MRMRIITTMLIIPILSACTMAPGYIRPAAPVPAEWPKGAAYKEQTGSAENHDLAWQKYFCDERLKRVIELALSNGRDLRIAALNVEKARALYGIQRAELFPAISAVGVMNRERVPADLSNTGGAYISDYYSVDAGVLSWELDVFGRIRSLKDKALEQYLSTEYTRRAVEVSLISSVATAYLVLAADRENLRLAESTLKAQNETYDLVQRRYTAGISSELDVKRAQTQVETAKSNVSLYTRVVALDENSINLLAGAVIPKDLLSETFSDIAPPKALSAGMSSEVLLNRPDVLSAEHQLRAMNANIGAARAAFFPRISLTSTIGTGSTELSRLFSAHSAAWTFAPQIVAPIFDARLWSGLKGVKIDREMAVAQYEKTIQTGFKEVADALAFQGTIESQLAAQESLVKASSDAYSLSNIRYSSGIDSYLNVLDAQRSLYAAQQGLIATRLTDFTSRVILYKALGGR
ncbi:MAG TPA: efflux transporter outer membrane subunit [Syntrophorhabdaceae bacterium]|nr:efflux transporter outer membrane subunit [Syntrophorhabdaceae bacterium]